METVDKDRRVADAYRTLGDDRYKDTYSYCAPDFLTDGHLLVPGPRVWDVPKRTLRFYRR